MLDHPATQSPASRFWISKKKKKKFADFQFSLDWIDRESFLTKSLVLC